MSVSRRAERGAAMPSAVALVSLGAVVLAGIAFVTTSDVGDEPDPVARPVIAASSPTPSVRPSTPPKVVKQPTKRKPKPAVRRGDVYVEVYNNSGISGLAGQTASTIDAAGWQVVGSDNWYGTIPSTTVYYPERLAGEAKLLAKDLGIGRLKPAISPMRFDRLTVILTADFA